MLHSMTAYAQAEQHAPPHVVSVEIRSYNSKYLDFAMRLPPHLQTFEEQIKAVLTQHLHRGRIELRLEVKTLDDGTARPFEVDMARARGLYAAYTRLRDAFAPGSELPLRTLIEAGGVIKPLEIEQDLGTIWASVAVCLQSALAQLLAMRRREGDALTADLIQHLTKLETLIARIAEASEGLLPYYRQRLMERIQTLTQGLTELDPARISQEAALLADRSDISEELVRARSHLAQFRQIIAEEHPAGRKLNFLTQEFNREFNTMGAKTAKAEVSHMVVELKTELEKIREQVQNIE
jgi:uncharacterized protein (TIGR00255 family)